MKKFLAIALSIFMLVSIAACAASPEQLAQPEQSAANGETELTGGTLTIWCWDPAFNVFAMQEAARIYQEINPGFEINIVEMEWYGIQTALTTAATAGTHDVLPDIVLIQDNAFQMSVMTFPEIFTDLTNTGIPFNEFAPAKVGMSMVDGRNFGVPFDNGTTITALRTDILAEAGYTMADFENITWNEFIQLGRSVLAQTGMPLLSTVSGGGDYVAAMLQSAGASLFNPDGSPNIAGNPIILEVVNVYLELVNSGVLLEVNNWDEYIGSFVNGTVAGTMAGCWILGSVQSAEDQAGNWGVTSIPRLNIPEGTNYSNWGGSSWAITSNANVELAVDFLRHTFAGSIELYEIILPAAGALSTWSPAASSIVYTEPQEFFGGQAVFADIVRFSANVPAIDTGLFFYEARDAVSFAMVDILGGANVEQALQQAHDNLAFQIG